MLFLDFLSKIPGTVLDENGEGTGFTSIQPNKNGNEYDLSRVDLDPLTGSLVLTGTRGSNANLDNTLKNALQVELDGTETFTVSTRLLNPFDNLTGYLQQGGIFIGSNQDNYSKLVVVNHGRSTSAPIIEFYREEQGKGIRLEAITGLDWSNIDTLDLFLSGNPETNEITAAYRVNSDTAKPIPLNTPFEAARTENFFADTATARAGILAFSKNSPDVPITFDSFGVAQDVKINFQPGGAPLPAEYIKDSGLGYNTNRGFGWVTQSSAGSASPTPIRISAYARDRNRSGVDQRLDTFLHMQYPNTTAAAWEYKLPNGTYSVTVSVGDRLFDSQHTINVEGVKLIDRFQGNAKQEYRLATTTVTVSDGRLTVDALGGTNTKINYLEIDPISPDKHPEVSGSEIAGDSRGAFLDAAVNVDIAVATVGAGVDPGTLNTNTVQLYRTRDNAPVPGEVNTTGGGDAIVYQPSVPLAPNTNYTFRVTDNVRDEAGDTFIPYSTTFNTGVNKSLPPTPGVQFTKKVVYEGAPISTLFVSPQGRLYAAGLDGSLHRWTINANGELSGEQVFTDPQNQLEGRAIIGLAINPSDRNEWYLWTTVNDPLPAPGDPRPADFSSKVSKLTFRRNTTGFEGVLEDYIVGLPRSAKDHLSNSLVFGPDENPGTGVKRYLYMTQGSNTAMGAPDRAWGNRPERLLSAAVLKIDPALTPPQGGFNVQTEDYYDNEGNLISTGNYDPEAPNAPVTIFATGVRNAYDLVWHSNGYLYVPTNGSAAGGNTPNNPNTPENEALRNVATQNDYLFKIEPEGGGYYGHPNPKRGEYILNGGNPTAGIDPAEVVAKDGYAGYAVGIETDPNYRGFAYDFDRNRSPNGIIEYKSAPSEFGDALQNQLLIVEYSSGDDILALDPGADGNIALGSATRLTSGLTNPLDLIEDTIKNPGNLYVAELNSDGASGQITLLEPTMSS